MILVLLGTQNNSFIRLIEEIEKNIKNGLIKEDVVVQAGYTKYESEHMKIFDFVQLVELEKLQEEASVIITHGGVSSIVSSIKKGKKVIAVSRLKEYKEHVNNHQTEIVDLFDSKGYLIGIKDVTKLQEAIIKSKNFKPKEFKTETNNIINIVEDFINNN